MDEPVLPSEWRRESSKGAAAAQVVLIAEELEVAGMGVLDLRNSLESTRTGEKKVRPHHIHLPIDRD